MLGKAADGAGGSSGKRQSSLRGTTKLLFVGMVTFIGIALLLLVVLYILHLPAVHLGSKTVVGRLLPNPDLGDLHDSSAGAALASSMLKIGTFERYDRDRDGKLNHDEFHHFLIDLGKSSLLDEKAKKVVAAGDGGNVMGGRGPSQGEKTERKTEEKAEQKTEEKAEQKTEPKTEQKAEEKPVQVAEEQEKQEPVQVTDQKAVEKTALPPSGTCPELSKELVASFAKNNTIMLAVCDWRMFETFGINWMKHLNHLKVDYFLVGSTDRKTAKFLSGRGNHPCFKFFEEGAEGKMAQEYKYGDEHYIEAVWRKVSVVERIVDWGFNVIMSDVDVVWLRDPLSYVTGPHMSHVDLAVSTDLVSTSNLRRDEGLEVNVFPNANVNTGVYFVRSTPGGRKIMKTWVDLRAVMKHENDQIGMYRVLRNNKAQLKRDERALYYPDMNGGSAKVGFLSVAMLGNGYSYFIAQLPKFQEVNALGVHMTWLPLCREGKFHRMRDGMLYYDPPKYYSEPMFITADIDFPETPEGFNSWSDTEQMIQTHVALMDKQMVQIYRAMAVAVLLNRTLVLPKTQCYCYKNWFMSEQCRIPGDRVTKFPMDCAMDQWLRPKVMYNYGENIVDKDGVKKQLMFREYTLFDNPRFPQELRKEEVIVTPGGATCGQGSDCKILERKTEGGKQVIVIPKTLSQNKLMSVFEPLKSQKIIRLKGVMNMFSGFDDEVLKKSFEAFLDKVAVNWCCRAPADIKKGMKEKEKLAIHW